jgi:hypothetical protein
MRRILDLSEYEHLAFNAEHWSLALGEETYRLLDDLFADYLPCFSSRYVNICCDESFDITGTTAGTHADAAAGGTPHAEVPEGAMRYLAHITRLHEMLARHGKTVMMWDDIFLHWPELLQRVPRDTILLDWYYEAQDSYPQIATVVASGRPAMVCPGTSSWNSLFARVDNARANIRNFVRSGRQAGAFGMLNTDWGDGGHPNLPASSLYGLAYGAAEAWNPGALDDDEFDRRLGIQLAGERSGGAVVRAMRAMGEACTLPRVARVNGSCTWAMFFRDPVPHEVCSTIPDETVARVRELAVEALDLLSDVAPDGIASKETFDELRFAARSIVHAADRTVLGRRIDAHIGGADAELWRAATELKIELHDLRHEFERLWLARYNRGGWWLALDLFDAAAQVEDRWRTTVAPRYQFNA